jgi:hypothetical protein
MPKVNTVASATMLALVLLSCSAAIGLAQVEILPFKATYRYLVTPTGPFPIGAEDPGFDDSAFSTGPAPFGFNTPGYISWGLGEYLTARRHFYLTGSPTEAVLDLAFMGAGSFFINGVLVCQLQNCAGGHQTLPLCDGILRAGDNVWVANCIATGVGIYVGSYFDATITATGATPTNRASWGQLKLMYR